jgi:hypothetical protein
LPTIYAALLQTAGASTQFALFVQTVMLFLSAMLLQFALTYRLSKSEFAACMSVPVVFLPGGFGFLKFLSNRTRFDPNVEYIFFLGSMDFNMWGHPMLHCILTSRVVLLTLSLSILGFCAIEYGLVHFPGVIGLVMVIIRPQTAVSYFACFFLYRWQNVLWRAIYTVPAFMLFKYIHLRYAITEPLWVFHVYVNSLIPPLKFAFRIFGLMVPALGFVVATPKLIGRLLGPVVTFYALSVISLQTELRFNFFALLATVVPILVALTLAILAGFRDRWSSEETRGVINCLIVFAVVFMCLSSLAGIWARLDQKFVAWDSDAIDLAKWIQKETSPLAVFASQIPGRWNPAVAIAGRRAFYPFQPTIQSADYAIGDRAAEFRAFVYLNTSLADVDYFVVEKKTDLAGHMAKKVGSLVDLEYENDRFRLYRARV